MRRIARYLLLLAIVSGCKDHPSSPAEIADRGWSAHELVISAGERAKSCAEAGPAMQHVFAAHRQEFVDAIALDQDRDRLRQATEYLEAHHERYDGLETRMEALSERCVTEASVQTAFREMESP